MPLATDVYDPTIPSRGNSNYGNDDFKDVMIWDKQYSQSVDLRLFYTHLEASDWNKCRWDPLDESIPKFYRISSITNS